jgi:hypothetical protein
MDGSQAADGGVDGAPDASSPDAEVCSRAPRPADRERRVVVSHPYDTEGGDSDLFEAWPMTAGGTISFGGATFAMGRTTLGRIAFTPDGEVGLLAQEDGTLGVFRIDEQHSFEVLHSRFQGEFYAASVVMDPSGQRAYVLDTQWEENGGGIYSVRIDCDGHIEEEGLIVGAKLPYDMLRVPDGTGRVVVVAKSILGSAEQTNVHLLDWSTAPSLIDSVDAFGDDEAIVSDAAITSDGRYVLIGDNSGFSSVPNRVAVVEVTPTGLTPTQVISPIEDPIDVVTSPYDNAALVVSGFGDAIFVLDYDPDGSPSAPFSIRGELPYTGSSPALPGKAVMLRRGQLAGTVFVAENIGVRQVVFEADGAVTDLGLSSPGSGLQNVVGAVGVQP